MYDASCFANLFIGAFYISEDWRMWFFHWFSFRILVLTMDGVNNPSPQSICVVGCQLWLLFSFFSIWLTSGCTMRIHSLMHEFNLMWGCCVFEFWKGDKQNSLHGINMHFQRVHTLRKWQHKKSFFFKQRKRKFFQSHKFVWWRRWVLDIHAQCCRFFLFDEFWFKDRIHADIGLAGILSAIMLQFFLMMRMDKDIFGFRQSIFFHRAVSAVIVFFLHNLQGCQSGSNILGRGVLDVAHI